MATDWSLDYCLACDRQTAGEPYCSQACRLADLETSTGSELSSSSRQRSPPTSWTPSSRSPTRFYLPPPFDFAAYRSTAASAPVISPRPVSAHDFPSSTSLSQSTTSPRVLTPSSSRSSLTSVQSTAGPGEAISTQARTELRDYTNSFDQVRDWRRRMTAT